MFHFSDPEKLRLSNNYERLLFYPGDAVPKKEEARYKWAAANCEGCIVLEIGCSNGYGSQYLSKELFYSGIDYDREIIQLAKQQYGSDHHTFACKEINGFFKSNPGIFYHTIIAFEIIEHLESGLELVETLKKHCQVLLISVPRNESKGYWGEHHKLHNLTEDMFKGFSFVYLDEEGLISSKPSDNCLMLMKWRGVKG